MRNVLSWNRKLSIRAENSITTILVDHRIGNIALKKQVSVKKASLYCDDDKKLSKSESLFFKLRAFKSVHWIVELLSSVTVLTHDVARMNKFGYQEGVSSRKVQSCRISIQEHFKNPTSLEPPDHTCILKKWYGLE